MDFDYKPLEVREFDEGRDWEILMRMAYHELKTTFNTETINDFRNYLKKILPNKIKGFVLEEEVIKGAYIFCEAKESFHRHLESCDKCLNSFKKNFDDHVGYFPGPSDLHELITVSSPRDKNVINILTQRVLDYADERDALVITESWPGDNGFLNKINTELGFIEIADMPHNYPDGSTATIMVKIPTLRPLW